MEEEYAKREGVCSNGEDGLIGLVCQIGDICVLGRVVSS